MSRPSEMRCFRVAPTWRVYFPRAIISMSLIIFTTSWLQGFLVGATLGTDRSEARLLARSGLQECRNKEIKDYCERQDQSSRFTGTGSYWCDITERTTDPGADRRSTPLCSWDPTGAKHDPEGCCETCCGGDFKPTELREDLAEKRYAEWQLLTNSWLQLGEDYRKLFVVAHKKQKPRRAKDKEQSPINIFDKEKSNDLIETRLLIGIKYIVENILDLGFVSKEGIGSGIVGSAEKTGEGLATWESRLSRLLGLRGLANPDDRGKRLSQGPSVDPAALPERLRGQGVILDSFALSWDRLSTCYDMLRLALATEELKVLRQTRPYGNLLLEQESKKEEEYFGQVHSGNEDKRKPALAELRVMKQERNADVLKALRETFDMEKTKKELSAGIDFQEAAEGFPTKARLILARSRAFHSKYDFGERGRRAEVKNAEEKGTYLTPTSEEEKGIYSKTIVEAAPKEEDTAASWVRTLSRLPAYLWSLIGGGDASQKEPAFSEISFVSTADVDLSDHGVHVELSSSSSRVTRVANRDPFLETVDSEASHNAPQPVKRGQFSWWNVTVSRTTYFVFSVVCSCVALLLFSLFASKNWTRGGERMMEQLQREDAASETMAATDIVDDIKDDETNRKKTKTGNKKNDKYEGANEGTKIAPSTITTTEQTTTASGDVGNESTSSSTGCEPSSSTPYGTMNARSNKKQRDASVAQLQ
ncbi:unnamed protein product [Amoebophrya sp. A25]|nr:unnamed protein product [Amoebophrya sp. A25]|eukprot:GSA25T00003985001.1